MWTPDGLRRVGRLVKRSFNEHYDGNQSAMSRATGGINAGTLMAIMRLEKYRSDEETPMKIPSKETLEKLAPFIEIPFLDNAEKFYPGCDRAFSADELLSVADGVLAPRVSEDDTYPALTRAIMDQAEVDGLTARGVAKKSGISEDRLQRILALGGWANADRANMVEIIMLGTWYGAVEKLAKAMNVPFPGQQTPNHSQSPLSDD